jgi:DNA polymerase
VEGTLNEELLDLVRAARVLLAEWSEEGLERIDPPEPTRESPPPASAPPPRETGHTGELFASGTWPEGVTLEQVRTELGDCQRCPLHEGRTQGEQEDLRGIPFCGRAGELLTQMIEKGLGIPRSDVYICNIVKCRPPDNRAPHSDEAATCARFLDGQIAAVRPRVIVALGKPATSLLLGRDVAISRVRGTWQEYRGVPVMPTFHPAYVLRQYTPEVRRKVWDDLRAALMRVQEG